MTVKETVKVTTEENKEENSMDAVAPKSIGKLDMMIAFDTTGSMAQYIGAVRQEVAELIPAFSRITTTCVSALSLSATTAT